MSTLVALSQAEAARSPSLDAGHDHYANLDTDAPLVNIIVGEGPFGQQGFQVHSKVMLDHSAWFERQLACIPRNTMYCPSAQPDTFALFKEFVYTGRLEKGVPRARPNKTAKLHISIKYKVISEAWLLGEQLGAVSFQDQCLRTWNLKRFADYQTARPYISVNEICAVWQQTGTGSTLRKFLIDSYAHMNLSTLFRSTNISKMPGDFLLEVACAYAQKHDGKVLEDSKEFWRTRDIGPFRAKLPQVIMLDEVDLTSDADSDDAPVNRQVTFPGPTQTKLPERHAPPTWLPPGGLFVRDTMSREL